MTKENKALKRTSLMLMPLIPELPENLTNVTFDPEAERGVNCDMADVEGSSNEEVLLQTQTKITGQTKLLMMEVAPN